MDGAKLSILSGPPCRFCERIGGLVRRAENYIDDLMLVVFHFIQRRIYRIKKTSLNTDRRSPLPSEVRRVCHTFVISPSLEIITTRRFTH